MTNKTREELAQAVAARDAYSGRVHEAAVATRIVRDAYTAYEAAYAEAYEAAYAEAAARAAAAHAACEAAYRAAEAAARAAAAAYEAEHFSGAEDGN